MGNKRTVIIIAALVVALIAGVATYSYLDTTQERANKDARLVEVYKVKKDIPKGFSGDQAIAEGYIDKDEIPEKFRPLTSVVDVNTIKGKVSLTALSANQVVVEGQFVDPRIEQVTFSERIPPGQVAITLSYDAVRAVAGLPLGDTRTTAARVEMRNILGSDIELAHRHGVPVPLLEALYAMTRLMAENRGLL